MQSTEETRKEIEVFLKSKYGAVWLRTAEEYRARGIVEQIARTLKCKVVFWSCINGFGHYVEGRLIWQVDVTEDTDLALPINDLQYPVNLSTDGVVHDDALSALRAVRKDPDRALYCFFDVADFLEDKITGPEPRGIRALRELCASLGEYPAESAKAIVFIDRKPSPNLPNVAQLDFPLPNKEEVEAIVSKVIDNLPNSDTIKLSLVDNGKREEIISAVRGLEAEAISSAIRTSVVATSEVKDGKIIKTGEILPERLLESKKSIVALSGFVEWLDPDPAGLANIGGYELLKARIKDLRSRFTTRAQNYGLRPPMGLFVGGVPGSGKSALFAAMLTEWQFVGMLVRPIESKFVGESQANMLQVFRIARAVAPCALLWDEAEKTFAAASSDSSGVTLKLLGILLTEMQKDYDKRTGVFHYFTANDPLNVEGALLRRCETGGLFWVDLPNRTELKAICEVMKRRYPITAEVNGEQLAEVAFSAQLTGGEVEIAFLNGMDLSFKDDERKTQTEDIVKGIKEVVPVIKSYRIRIEALRTWGKDVKPASVPDKVAARASAANDKLKSLM